MQELLQQDLYAQNGRPLANVIEVYILCQQLAYIPPLQLRTRVAGPDQL
jgi:hypothetical protein